MDEFPEFGRALTPQAGRIKFLTHRKSWVDSARPNQLPPADDWDIWLTLAGRGFGKTRLAGEKVAWDAWVEPGTITHVVAATHGDLRSVCYEGQSGLLSIIPPECIMKQGYNRSLGEIYLTNGSIFRGFSAEAPERMRGPQCHRAWGDEIAAWDQKGGSAQDTFDQLMFGLRLGNKAYAVLTTTPKPIMLIKNLVNLYKGIITEHNKALEELRVRVTTGSTRENYNNLSRNFQIIVSQYEGTRLGRQELDAEILDDTPGALWTSEVIDKNRRKIKDLPDLVRIVVSVDPAASTNENSDETGIIVAGIDEDGHGWVLKDASGKMTPNEWAKTAVSLFQEYSADCIVGEINNGGDMVENTVRGVDQHVPFKGVRATRGKALRAEPIASLYDQGFVHHVGILPRLEDQLCMLTTDFNRTKAKYSPDRADALVWAITDLLLGEMDGMGIYEFYRQRSRTATEDKIVPASAMVIMRTFSNSPITTFYNQAGKKFDVNHGKVTVPESDVPALERIGFVRVELVEGEA